MLVKKRQPAHAKTIKLYNMFRNRVNREIKKSKNNYYNNYFESHYNDIKKTWQGIRSIININHSITPTITQLNVNGKLFNKLMKLQKK